MLERERELEALEEVLHRARLGDGGLVVVEGAAGIGKSRLMEELRERGARAGLRVLAEQGSDLEREFAFGVVRQLFEARVHGPGGAESPRHHRDSAGCWPVTD